MGEARGFPRARVAGRGDSLPMAVLWISGKGFSKVCDEDLSPRNADLVRAGSGGEKGGLPGVKRRRLFTPGWGGVVSFTETGNRCGGSRTPRQECLGLRETSQGSHVWGTRRGQVSKAVACMNL